MRFAGKVALITGAAGGFGRATAAAFAAEGAKLVLSDLDAGALDEAAGGLDAEVAVLAGDVAERDLHFRLVELARERFGGLDVAVNNAGIAHDPGRLPAIPEEVARRVIEVDLIAVMWALQAQIPAMDPRTGGRRGAIVNIASVAGIGGAPMLSPYAAAKHGVVGLTKTAALECAAGGLRVNAICPAFARTPMVREIIKGAPSAEAGEAKLSGQLPMRRIGEAAEIAAAILLVADPANSFMTGQALAVDGGLTAM